MYDKRSREIKAIRIIKTLERHFGKKMLNNLNLLDIGTSTGIIASKLADKFKSVVGIDLDSQGIKFAQKNNNKKNLKFAVDDAINLKFKDNSFDIVICTHIYEHVQNPEKLFSEIYRVLKTKGVCYLAATNSLWPLEPHYKLPFLSWLPKNFANIYVRLFGKANNYDAIPRTYWGIKKLTKKFRVHDYTQQILSNPKDFGFEDKIKGAPSVIFSFFSPLAKYFSPTFFWLLEKD